MINGKVQCVGVDMSKARFLLKEEKKTFALAAWDEDQDLPFLVQMVKDLPSGNLFKISGKWVYLVPDSIKAAQNSPKIAYQKEGSKWVPFTGE